MTNKINGTESLELPGWYLNYPSQLMKEGGPCIGIMSNKIVTVFKLDLDVGLFHK